jgi:isocitrate dehydrogenase
MTSKFPNLPPTGSAITIQNLKLNVPDQPILPFIEGDGSGPDIWRASRRVFDAAVEQAYGGKRQIQWMEVYAGQKAFDLFNSWLPDDTMAAFEQFKVGIKGPLTTPIGGGIRSLNVALRKNLDLYTCLRPVRWFQGVPSPTKHPELMNMVIFRENTEDIYSGIEFPSGTPENEHFLELLKEHFPSEYAKLRFTKDVGIGVKNVSVEGAQRIVRAAIRWALQNGRKRVTLVHKGNIMKYTEGAFRAWGYELAEREFGDKIYTLPQWNLTKSQKGDQAANEEMDQMMKAGKLYINDIITDACLERTITNPPLFDVLATTNLNGDLLSDALAAQVGGIGIAPGGNINFETGIAVFEATHGTAPGKTGKDLANPSSVILSGEMMLRYLGWKEAADLIIRGIEATYAAKLLTIEMIPISEGATQVKCSEFGDAIIRGMKTTG